MNKVLGLLVIIAFIVSTTGCSSTPNAPTSTNPPNQTASPAAAPAKTWNLKANCYVTSTNIKTKLLQQFADKVAERTNGRVKITVYPGEGLYPVKESFDAVSVGALDINAIGPSQEGAPYLSMLGLVPFVWTGVEHLDKSFKAGLLDMFNQAWEEKYNVKMLPWNLEGINMVLSSNKKLVEKPDDLKGQKVRTAGAFTPLFVKACGGESVTVSGSETYMALQTGVADANFNNPEHFVSRKIYEVQKYFTVGPMSITLSLQNINRKIWQSFPPDIQKIVMDTGTEILWDSCLKTIAAVDEESTKVLEKEVTQRGGKVYRMTSADLTTFRPYAKSCLDLYTTMNDKDKAKKVLDTIESSK